MVVEASLTDLFEGEVVREGMTKIVIHQRRFYKYWSIARDNT